MDLASDSTRLCAKSCFRKRLRNGSGKPSDVGSEETADFVLVFNMGGTMRVFRTIRAPGGSSVFNIKVNEHWIRARVQDSDEGDGECVPFDVILPLDGAFRQREVPIGMVAWGPYKDLSLSQYFHQPGTDFTVYNMSGKLNLDATGLVLRRSQLKASFIFKDTFHPCLDTYVNFFGYMSNIYHLNGNVQYQDDMRIVFFKGFRSTRDIVSTLNLVLRENLCEDIDINVNMIVSSCNIGMYVDISEHSILYKLFHRRYGEKVRFLCRSEQHSNVVIFNVVDIPGFFQDIPHSWSGNCKSFSCTMTRKGILGIRVSFLSRLRWTMDCEELCFRAMESVKEAVLDCV